MFQNKDGSLNGLGWGAIIGGVVLICVIGYQLLKPKPKPTKASLNAPIVMVEKAPSIAPSFSPV